MIQIENNKIQITIAEKGAELQSIKANGLEYMWSGDPTFWGKHSPVLFPIVGGLKNNSYSFDGKSYQLGRHGFARNTIFTVLDKPKNGSVLLGISDSEETKKVYPFSFQFMIQYTLDEDYLHIEYSVKNTDTQPMYFSVGAHPAFAVPLEKHLSYEDYSLLFNKQEDSNIFPLDDNGQTLMESVPFLKKTNELPLKKSLFYKDALVFKDLKSTEITLKSEKGQHGLTVAFEGFPYMGIWSAKDADFVCIEPWNGIADNVKANGDITQKEGIHSLQPAEVFRAKWSIRFF
ncbi:MAG: aldose epimerase [Pseudopedobacter saltans]|uniref:Aldose epimerase n=1 Tax=Pseudopedobacter saltans TaxID=151895 RepID=A0A2W5F7A8_9SPHI|nr:MAG: aldose epimerase [Pseudopedobacter saltans]